MSLCEIKTKAPHKSNFSKRLNFEALDWIRLINRTLSHTRFADILEFVCVEMFPTDVGCNK